MYVYLIKFGDETSSDETMFKSESYFLATGEDELIKIVEYEFERLGIRLIDFNDLRNTASIEGLIFDVAEVAEYLLYFALH